MSRQRLYVLTDWETGLPVEIVEGRQHITLRELTNLWGTQELRDRFEIEVEETETDQHPNPFL